MKINDIVFTDHAIQRMKERGISGNWAYQAVKYPEESRHGKKRHTKEFLRRFDSRTVTAVAKKNDIGEWVILSAWIDPPYPGTEDSRKRNAYTKKLSKYKVLNKKMERASFWGKLWITFRKQTGL